LVSANNKVIHQLLTINRLKLGLGSVKVAKLSGLLLVVISVRLLLSQTRRHKTPSV